MISNTSSSYYWASINRVKSCSTPEKIFGTVIKEIGTNPIFCVCGGPESYVNSKVAFAIAMEFMRRKRQQVMTLLYDRKTSSIVKNYLDLKKDTDIDLFRNLFHSIEDDGPFHDQNSSLSFTSIASEITRRKQEQNLGLIVLDNLSGFIFKNIGSEKKEDIVKGLLIKLKKHLANNNVSAIVIANSVSNEELKWDSVNPIDLPYFVSDVADFALMIKELECRYRKESPHIIPTPKAWQMVLGFKKTWKQLHSTFHFVD